MISNDQHLFFKSSILCICLEKVVHLVGGRGSYEGRVEVYYNGTWGTVCDDYFDLDDANVICRYLEFPGVEAAYHRAHFGQGSEQIWVDNLECSGNEYSPFSCSQNTLGQHNCRHSEDAGVRCQSKLHSTATVTCTNCTQPLIPRKHLAIMFCSI